MTDARTDAGVFRRLAELYAQAVDRNRPDLLNEIMTADVVVEAPGFTATNLHEARRMPVFVREKFRRTRHLVHNQTITVERDDAHGETYGTASHLYESKDGALKILVWHIRYQDEFRREAGTWKFRHRRLELDWTEVRPVRVGEDG